MSEASVERTQPFDPAEWVVVMPSIREINLEYLAHVPESIRVLVVDDSNGSIEPNRENMEVFRYDDYREHLGADEDLIPRKTDTCRSFGFYIAHQRGYQYIVTLDDDCATHPGFMDGHGIVGRNLSLPAVSQEPWYNTLDSLQMEVDGEAVHAYARGVPYCFRDESTQPVRTEIAGRVVANMGLWLKVPDINGLDKLGKEIPVAVGVKDERLAIAPATMFSLCIMNVAILAEAIPAFYQLPMGETVCGMRLDRFGDIWSGYLLKKLADIRGDLLCIGGPAVTHTKQGNTIRETQVEHHGHLLEGIFYPLVDEAAAAIQPADYAVMYHQLGTNLLNGIHRAKLAPAYAQLLAQLAEKMVRWAELFQRGAAT